MQQSVIADTVQSLTHLVGHVQTTLHERLLGFEVKRWCVQGGGKFVQADNR